MTRFASFNGSFTGVSSRAKTSYVFTTSGLVLSADASVTASYPGTGTTWTDTVGNRTASLTNTTYSTNFGGYFICNGSQTIFWGNPTSTLAQDITYDIWFRTSSATTYQTLFWDDDSQGGGDAWVNINTNGTIQSNRDTDGFGVLATTATITADTWYHFTMTSAAATGKVLYLNGVQVASNSVPIATRANRSYFSYGASYDSVTVNKDRMANNSGIAAGHIWNRALTATEVFANFASTKARFGL